MKTSRIQRHGNRWKGRMLLNGISPGWGVGTETRLTPIQNNLHSQYPVGFVSVHDWNEMCRLTILIIWHFFPCRLVNGYPRFLCTSRPWKWWRYNPSRRGQPFTNWYGVTSQMAWILTPSWEAQCSLAPFLWERLCHSRRKWVNFTTYCKGWAVITQSV